MHSRAWFGIVIIGVLGVVAMGFMTKLAIDSNTDLQHIIRFKAAFAEEFRGQGIEEVALRKRKGGGGYHLVLTSSRVDQGDPMNLDRRIARYFVENFGDKSARVLELSYMLRGSFGCISGDPYRQQEIPLHPVRTGLALESSRNQLTEVLQKDFGCRITSEKREGRALFVDLECSLPSAGDLRALALKVEPSVRRYFQVEPYARLHLRVLREAPGSASPAASAVEVRFDPRGKEIAE